MTRTGYDRRATRFVTGLDVGAALTMVAVLALWPPGTTSMVRVGALLVAGTLAIVVPLRLERGGQTQGFNLEEAVFVAALLSVPVGYVPVISTLAALVGYTVRARSPIKVAFNVGQVGLWASGGAWVFAAIGPGDGIMSPRTLAAVVVAVLTANVVSLSAMSELFRRIADRPRLETLREAWRLNAITAVGNTSFGLLLGFVAIQDPWATVLASTLMVALYMGYRGYVGLVEERSRSERLHTVTSSLVAMHLGRDAFSTFLDGLSQLMGSERASLLLTGSAEQRLYSRPDDGGDSEVLARAARREKLTGERHGSDSYQVLAAPLSSPTGTAGAISVEGRRGLEPWSDSDLNLLGAVANEAAVALKNVELFQQVERERARWEAESTKLGDIVNAATDGIAMFSSDGSIQTWNDAMAMITGLPTDEAVGQPWFVTLRLRDADGNELLPSSHNSVVRAVAGERFREPIELQVLRRDGVWRVLRATFAPIHREDTHPAGTVMVARDVTAEREVEGLKADFIATVSHELRTPLTPLRGFLQTLAANRDKLDEDQVETIYNSMDSQLGRLERLIADLLVVADLETGTTQLNRDPVDLLETAAVAVAHEASSDTERVMVHGHEDVVAAGDRKAIVRIVRSLVSNALKHTEGPVEVLIDQEGEEGLILVIDDGPGIAPWEQKEIFKRFRRLGDHLTRNQGPGLGLPIAAALAERLEGKVTVESDVGEGSTFTLHLPLSRPRLVAGHESADTSTTQVS